MPITKRAKRAAGRHEVHSYVHVERIVRTAPSTWIVLVEYTYGLSSWTERVSFTKRAVTRREAVVSVTDSDFPGDRKSHILVTKDRDMSTVITEYLIAGRW